MNNLAQVFKSMIVCDGVTEKCTYTHFIELVRVVIDNLIVLAIFLATIGFIYVGFKLMTAGGDEGAMKEAKEMFKKIVIGFVWILAAWLVVYTITSTLLQNGYFILGPK